jgi:hypothetical protein
VKRGPFNIGEHERIVNRIERSSVPFPRSDMAERPLALAITVFLLTAYPPVASLVVTGVEASRQPFNITSLPALVHALPTHGTSILRVKAVDVALTQFQGDAFYYFTVAHRSIGMPYYTYDGTYPTNGFHPLWQYLLTNVFSLLPNQDAEILVAFAFSIIGVAVGNALFSLALYRVFSSLPLSILGAVPGVYALVLAPVHTRHATWALINGMESSLSVLFFGTLAYLLLAKDLAHGLPQGRGILIISTLVTLLTISRLDDIFLLIPFLTLIFLLSMDQGRVELLRRLALASALPIFVIGAYLLNNLRYAGLLLPVSGQLKLAPAIGDNVRILLQTFVPISQAIYTNDQGEWYSLSWRVLQVVVPAGVSLFWILRSRKGIRQALLKDAQGRLPDASCRFLVLAAFAGYVVIKAVYNLFAVGMWVQGSWYFPVSLMLTSLFCLILFREAFPRFVTIERSLSFSSSARIWTTLLTCLFVVLLANFAVDERRRTNFDRRLSLWHGRESISRDLLLRYDGKGLLEFADGIIGYALSIPTMSGIGLTLDKEAMQAKQRGRLLDLAYRRGFRAFASLNYFTLPARDDEDPARVQRAVESFSSSPAKHRSAGTSVSYIAIPHRKPYLSPSPPSRWRKANSHFVESCSL